MARRPLALRREGQRVRHALIVSLAVRDRLRGWGRADTLILRASGVDSVEGRRFDGVRKGRCAR